MMKQAKLKEIGFTLIEGVLAIILFSLLMTGAVSLYTKTLALSKSEQADLELRRIKQKLLNYVQVNGYLPCPDVDASQDGYGDRKDNDPNKGCKSRFGRLPWNEIGSKPKDPWGNYYFYRINAKATNNKEIHNLCSKSSAGVFGKKGDLFIDPTGVKPYYCISNKSFYCLDSPITGGDICPNDEWQLINEKVDSTNLKYNENLLMTGKWPYRAFIGMFSPPTGYTEFDDESRFFLKIFNDEWLSNNLSNNQNVVNDPADNIDHRMALQVQAIVISFGQKNAQNIWSGITKSNGSIVGYYSSAYRNFTRNNCQIDLDGTIETRIEAENCDRDRHYVYSKKSDDKLIWITNIDIKGALIKGGAL